MEEPRLSTKTSSSEKEKFNNDLEYFMSLMGFAAGFGSIWRFPYLSNPIT
jgi:SNF family Na+-dependent transporter